MVFAPNTLAEIFSPVFGPQFVSFLIPLHKSLRPHCLHLSALSLVFLCMMVWRLQWVKSFVASRRSESGDSGLIFRPWSQAAGIEVPGPESHGRSDGVFQGRSPKPNCPPCRIPRQVRKTSRFRQGSCEMEAFKRGTGILPVKNVPFPTKCHKESRARCPCHAISQLPSACTGDASVSRVAFGCASGRWRSVL
jgi:hypothetical protein